MARISGSHSSIRFRGTDEMWLDSLPVVNMVFDGYTPVELERLSANNLYPEYRMIDIHKRTKRSGTYLVEEEKPIYEKLPTVLEKPLAGPTLVPLVDAAIGDYVTFASFANTGKQYFNDAGQRCCVLDTRIFVLSKYHGQTLVWQRIQ
jgi:hypothetical protein